MVEEVYRCCFLHELCDESLMCEIVAYDVDDAAEKFAAMAFGPYEMYETTNWEGDNAVVVEGPDGVKQVCSVEMSYDPNFHSNVIGPSNREEPNGRGGWKTEGLKHDGGKHFVVPIIKEGKFEDVDISNAMIRQAALDPAETGKNIALVKSGETVIGHIDEIWPVKTYSNGQVLMGRITLNTATDGKFLFDYRNPCEISPKVKHNVKLQDLIVVGIDMQRTYKECCYSQYVSKCVHEKPPGSEECWKESTDECPGLKAKFEMSRRK